MKDEIIQIRKLLDAIDANSRTEAEACVSNFDALELPSIICSIVDNLMPDLSPIEIAMYWYLFRKCILTTGQQYTRVGQSELFAIAASPVQGKEAVSIYSIRAALRGLQDKNVISIAGDTTKLGSLYKIHLPDEIPTCIEKLKFKAVAKQDAVDIKKELDYYNNAENRLKIFERDSYECHYCKKQLTRFSATLDHLQPVSKGGDNSFDNLVTACLHCNSERGNKELMKFIIEKQ